MKSLNNKLAALGARLSARRARIEEELHRQPVRKTKLARFMAARILAEEITAQLPPQQKPAPAAVPQTARKSEVAA